MTNVVTILLAQDDKEVKDIRKVLNQLNLLYRLVVVNNGREALSVLEDRDIPLPELILLDLHMKGMNSFRWLKEIRSREEWKQIKCFLITTSDIPLDKNIARELGVSGCIQKPFRLNNLSSIDFFNLMIDLINAR
jgi:CheY-like chemotaxis protein